jgi:hypothetical protein
MEMETRPMKATEHRIYSKALFVIILGTALFYLNPVDTRGHIPNMMNQNCPLFINTEAPRIHSICLRKDVYIAKDSESDNSNDEDGDDEDDDDWEA